MCPSRHGRRPGLSFYRDISGNEVDPLLERGRELAAIDVKSAQTVTRDCFRGLNRFAGICGERIKSGAVVYEGREGQPRSDWQVWPMRDLGALSEKILPTLLIESDAFNQQEAPRSGYIASVKNT